MRILFMGTPSYATKIFEKLIKDRDINIVALITQLDKPVGRKQILTPPDIKQYVINNKIEIKILQPNSLKDEKLYEIIKELNLDFIIVAAYGKILPKEILKIAPCINLHASILPLYRGASPIQEAILKNDKFSGVTAMKMDVGLDTGDILGYSFLKITNLKADELFKKLSNLAAFLTIKTIKNYQHIKPTPQNNADSSYCSKIKKSDGLIDFTNSKEIYLKFKAFCDWPQIHIENGLKIKMLKDVENESSNLKGVILEIKNKTIIVGCQKGSIEIYTVQPSSKKEMNVIDYIRGKRLTMGDIFK